MSDPYGEPRFAIIGAGGYIAPRHMRAIRDVGGTLVAACDTHDSVGVLDQYAMDCRFFSDERPFFAFVKSAAIDYVSVCSPNHLHRRHIAAALAAGCNVICEKPLVLSVAELDEVLELERRHERSVYTILQLRLHPAVAALRSAGVVKLEYNTPRGDWYSQSWKGDAAKSGGLLFNIGVHAFDVLLHMFGGVRSSALASLAPTASAGTLTLERATVEWSISLDRNRPPRRLLDVDGTLIDLGLSFSDLHSSVYRRILSAGEFRAAEARPAVALLEELRNHG